MLWRRQAGGQSWGRPGRGTSTKACTPATPIHLHRCWQDGEVQEFVRMPVWQVAHVMATTNEVGRVGVGVGVGRGHSWMPKGTERLPGGSRAAGLRRRAPACTKPPGAQYKENCCLVIIDFLFRHG